MRKYALLRRAGRLAAVVATLALASAQSTALASPTAKAAAPGTVRAGMVQVFNVKDYGAVGNGSTNDSPAINKAVTAANAAGGGVVEFPSGSYKSKNTIHLKSNVTIQLDAGSKILGSSANTYDAAESNPYSQYQDYGHSHFHDAMFYGDKVSNIGFTGSGTIDGAGNLITGNPGAGQADKILSLTRCTNLTLSGITLTRGGHFGALINGCDGVVSDHLTIATSNDRDGWNIISTTHVTITNANISSNDDALVFKSDYALGATLPSGHVTVTHATLKAGCCNALMFGSETCGSFTDYQFQDIAILGAGKSGLGMVSMDGADISDVHYKDITMSGVHSPIMQKIGTRKRCGGSPGVGHISNVTYENVTGTGVASTAYSPTIWGADSSHQVSNETFTNVNLTVPGGNGTMSTGVPSNSATDYNPNSIGTRPAYGWYLHNVSGIHFSGSSVKVGSGDGRPAVIANAGSDIRFDGLTAQTNSSSPYDVGFQNISGYCLSNSHNTSGGALRVSKSGSTENCAASAATADAAGAAQAPAVLADSLLSLNKPATASSSGGCCGPANVDDGNSATRWASAAGVDPQWIYVDLGTTAHVSRVRLQWDLSCATAYEVDVSADHQTWTKIYSTTAGKGGVEDLTALDGNGRYVRMNGTKRCRNDATHGYSLQELGVYGTTGTDTTPPGVPGTPTLVSDTSTSVTIAWTAATDNVGVTGYDIYHDGQLCAQVNGSTLTATCGSLSPNVAYGFYVNARDAAGNVGQPSGTLSVTTPPSSDTTPPTVPGGVHSTAVTSSSVTLAWTASTDNVAVAGYRIYNVVNGTRTKVGTADGTATSTQVDGLTPNTAYHFQVTAYDGNANESAGSTPILDVTTSPASNCAPSQGVCTATQVGTDDDVVWGLVTLPDGTILFNERDAHDIVHLNPKTGAKKSIGTVPNVQSTDGEGGLTGLELNPASFATDHWLYIMHTSPSDNRIVRIKYDPAADTLQTSTEQVLLTGIARNKYHNGGRLRFSPDGKYLFAGTGDAQNGANAQNTSSLNGKVLRINPDGSIPSDNPFHNAVWSYGHRNVQGLAFDSQGRLWEQEFGNSIMDETNLIVKGGNYGWPSCEGTSGTCGTAGFIAPKHTYPVAEGSCSGITIIRDFLYVACQRGTRLYREQISGSSLTNVQQFFNGTYGRLRTVEPAPDGGMWMATSNGGDKDSTPHNSNNQIFHVTVA